MFVGFVSLASDPGSGQADHRLGLGSIGCKANAFEYANEYIQSLLEPLMILGGKQAVVSIKECQSVANISAQAILCITWDHKGEPVSNHCIDHNIALIARFETPLDNATLWSDDGPMVSALVRGDLLGVSIMLNDAENVRANTILSQGLEGLVMVQGIAGLR